MVSASLLSARKIVAIPSAPSRGSLPTPKVIPLPKVRGLATKLIKLLSAKFVAPAIPLPANAHCIPSSAAWVEEISAMTASTRICARRTSNWAIKPSRVIIRELGAAIISAFNC